MYKFIFYALISEEKNKTLRMKGPFIHMRPLEAVKVEIKRYTFTTEDEIKKEKKYLTKKHTNEVLIVTLIELNVTGELTETLLNREKDRAFLLADDLFKKRFELMRDNFQICSR